MKRPERCDYSWLITTECAHCLGHKLDPDLEDLALEQIG